MNNHNLIIFCNFLRATKKSYIFYKPTCFFVFSILGFFNFFVCVVRDSTHGICTFIFGINFLVSDSTASFLLKNILPLWVNLRTSFLLQNIFSGRRWEDWLMSFSLPFFRLRRKKRKFFQRKLKAGTHFYFPEKR